MWDLPRRYDFHHTQTNPPWNPGTAVYPAPSNADSVTMYPPQTLTFFDQSCRWLCDPDIMDAAVKDQFTDHKDQSAEHKEQPNDRSLPTITVKPPTQVCVLTDLILSPFFTKSTSKGQLQLFVRLEGMNDDLHGDYWGQSFPCDTPSLVLKLQNLIATTKLEPRQHQPPTGVLIDSPTSLKCISSSYNVGF
jgi:hypothetical protein